MNFVQQHYFAQAVSQENDSQSSPAYPWIILVVTHTHTHTQVTRSMRTKLQNSTRNLHIQTHNKSVSNWILTSFQPHRVISGWSNCHKQHTHTHTQSTTSEKHNSISSHRFPPRKNNMKQTCSQGQIPSIQKLCEHNAKRECANSRSPWSSDDLVQWSKIIILLKMNLDFFPSWKVTVEEMLLKSFVEDLYFNGNWSSFFNKPNRPTVQSTLFDGRTFVM